MTRTTLTWSERFGQHDMGDWAIYIPPTGLVEPDTHLDNPVRTARLRRLIAKTGLEERLDVVVPRAATPEEIEAVHSAEHVARMAAVSEAGWGDAGGGFTPMNGDSYDLALLSAGSVLTCVERVLAGEADRAYGLGRRSGHHASRDTGYGFCIFNNVAVAAAAAKAGGVERIAIVDVDAHHGNGTEAIFYDDPSVLTISLHEDRMFPLETGSADDRGGAGAESSNLNVPLPAGTGDDGYALAFDAIVAPVVRAFAPELVIVGAGQDASASDPLGRMAVTVPGFRALTDRVVALAAEVCDGRLVAMLEGGYSLQHLPLANLAILEGLAGLAPSWSEDPVGCDVPPALRAEERAAVAAAVDRYGL